MIKRLISFFLTLVFLVAIPLSARYRYNPYTRTQDWYEPAGDITLGDIGDITLTGLATGNVLYYNGTAWVNLATGANADVLTLAAGIPSWAAGGAPAAHAASHEVGGGDLVDHDQLTNYLAAQHLTLPNTIVAVLTDHTQAAHVALGFLALPSTIAAVLTDHNLLAHTALGLFDQSTDVDHDLTTNYVAAQHLVLPSTIAVVLTDHNTAAHDALNIDADTVDGEHAAAIVTNARVKAHFPDTIANVLSDHNLLAHTALGLFDASADVDHDATTNWVANKHINWTAAADNFSTSEDFTLAWTEAADHAVITQASVTGVEDQALILIQDARTGIEMDEPDEATLVIHNTGGIYALYLKGGRYFQVDGRSWFYGDTLQFEDVEIRWSDAADHGTILQTAVAGTEDQPLIFINDDRTGATANELSEATIFLDAAGTYALNVAAGQAYFQDDTTQVEDVFITWADSADHMAIAQSSVTGTEGQALIYINDDRTGTTANSKEEAGLVLDSAGWYSLWVLSGAQFDGQVNFGDKAIHSDHIVINDDKLFQYGTALNLQIQWDTNGAQDALMVYMTGNMTQADESSAFVYGTANPNGMTDHNDYLSPTFVIANHQNADANDYAGVVIGERAQADVLVAHYFDFYAMVGATDGSTDPNVAELAAIFRFGPNGTGVPTYATTPGDVLFEGAVEVDGVLYADGGLTVPDGKLIELGTDADASFEYDETTNDALIFGVPIDGKRAIIICEKADIAADFTAIIPVTGQPKINMVDANYDSGLSLGFAGDDKPVLMSRAHPLHINYDALQPVEFFYSSEIGENQEVRIYGYDTGIPAKQYGRFFVDTAGKFTIDAQDSPIIFDKELRVLVSPANVSNPPTDAELDGVFGTPATVGAGFSTYINDNNAGNDFYHIASDGANWWIFSGIERMTKCYVLTNAALGKGSTVPDEIIVGNYWGWSYDINDDSVLSVKLPIDWVAGTDVEIHIRWAVNEDYVTNSGEVRWQVTWSAVPADASEAIGGAGTTDDSGDINIPATAYFLTQNLVETIPGASLAAGDEIGLTIKRIVLVGGADPTEDPVITCVGFVYTADKSGKAT